MRVVFYDDPDSESDVWEQELPTPPRIGDMISYPAPNGDTCVGKVTSIEWVLTKDEAIVEVLLDLM